MGYRILFQKTVVFESKTMDCAIEALRILSTTFNEGNCRAFLRSQRSYTCAPKPIFKEPGLLRIERYIPQPTEAPAPERNTMNTPHMHAEVIKAWADGAKIQSRNPGGVWIDTPIPGWYVNQEYRIKPANVVRFCAVIRGNDPGSTYITNGSENRDCALKLADRSQIIGILRVEINPDTKELVSSKMEAP